MLTTGPGQTPFNDHPHNQERVQSFTRWVREHLVGLAESLPPRSPLLILLDQDLAYAENPFSATLAPRGIDYDVMYVTARTAGITRQGYSHILIPATFAPDLKRKIPSGVKVIVSNSGWLRELPSPGIPKATPDHSPMP
jgi:hypothetical protein